MTATRFIRVAWLIVKKDLTIEARSRELVLTTLFFAVSCVLVFAFGFVHDQNPIHITLCPGGPVVGPPLGPRRKEKKTFARAVLAVRTVVPRYFSF